MSESDSMQLRNIEKKDIQAVFDLDSKFFAGPDKLDWGWTIEYVQFLEQYHKETFLVAVENNKVIGFQIAKAPISADKPTVGWLETLAVDEKYQKKGIGTALLEKAMTILREKGMKTVRLTSWETKEHLTKFYEKKGFKEKDKLVMRERRL